MVARNGAVFRHASYAPQERGLGRTLNASGASDYGQEYPSGCYGESHLLSFVSRHIFLPHPIREPRAKAAQEPGVQN
jgi:hypothetical protein